MTKLSATLAAGLTCTALLLAGCSVNAEQAGSSVQAAAPAASTATTCSIPDRFRGKDVTKLPVIKKLVALTFDAGANANAVDSILTTLANRDAKATFFLTGKFVQTFPVRSTRIANRFVVGNHTMTHPDLVKLYASGGAPAVRAQILQAQQAIKSVTGQDPRRFFRFPFGAVNANVIRVANNNCYVPFRWTVDSLGWKGTSGGMTRAKVIARVVGAATPGEIVLMHVGSNPDDGTMLDAAALPAIITQLRAKGYTFVSLARVMSAAP